MPRNVIGYSEGDTVEYVAFGGEVRVVVVEEKNSNLKNGLPGFCGGGWWGYDYQVTRLVKKAEK